MRIVKFTAMMLAHRARAKPTDATLQPLCRNAQAALPSFIYL
jgi:hypothetical protein